MRSLRSYAQHYYGQDGLNSTQYNVTSVVKRELYTHIKVKIQGPTNDKELRAFTKKFNQLTTEFNARLLLKEIMRGANDLQLHHVYDEHEDSF